MPLLTISEAARRCGVDRRTLQRAIASGRLTRTASGQVTLEALQQAGYAAPVPQVTPHYAAVAPQGMPHTPHLSAAGTPHDAALMPQALDRLLALLEAIAEDLHALRTRLVPRRATVTLLERPAPAAPQADDAHATRHAAVLSQETPRGAAPTPHRAAAPTPQEMRHAAEAPQSRPATPASPTTLPPYILAVAETAMQYDKLSLRDLAQLLFDRGIYRSRDRTTGAEKPVNKGTLLAWLNKARQAGVL